MLYNFNKKKDKYIFEIEYELDDEKIGKLELEFSRNELLENFYDGSEFIKKYPKELTKKIRKDYTIDLYYHKN